MQEELPDPAPFPVFFLPNFIGILLALLLEYSDVETKLASRLPPGSHTYSLLGLGIFILAMASSYLGGTVVLARLEYDVKLPNLYADKRDNKNAVQFNCIQRGHQNFFENLPQYILSTLFTALIANRPNVAGLLLVNISVCRVLYMRGYKTNIKSRLPPLLLAQFSAAVGIGYGFLVAASVLGVGPFVIKEE